MLEIDRAIAEQFRQMLSSERCGNVVKEEFHKGAIFGLNLAVSIMDDESQVEHATKDMVTIEQVKTAFIDVCKSCNRYRLGIECLPLVNTSHDLEECEMNKKEKCVIEYLESIAIVKLIDGLRK